MSKGSKHFFHPLSQSSVVQIFSNKSEFKQPTCLVFQPFQPPPCFLTNQLCWELQQFLYFNIQEGCKYKCIPHFTDFSLFYNWFDWMKTCMLCNKKITVLENNNNLQFFSVWKTVLLMMLECSEYHDQTNKVFSLHTVWCIKQSS